MSDKPNPFAKLDLPGILNFAGGKKRGRDKKYASFNRRMLAATIDSMLLLLTAPLLDKLAPINKEAFQKYMPEPGNPEAMRQWILSVVTDPLFIHSWLINLFMQIAMIWLFSGICWHFWSATPGKMLARIKIVDATTERHITDKQIFARLLGYLVSTAALCIGFFWIGMDKRHQAWHDKMAGTVVIALPWKWWTK